MVIDMISSSNNLHTFLPTYLFDTIKGYFRHILWRHNIEGHRPLFISRTCDSSHLKPQNPWPKIRLARLHDIQKVESQDHTVCLKTISYIWLIKRTHTEPPLVYHPQGGWQYQTCTKAWIVFKLNTIMNKRTLIINHRIQNRALWIKQALVTEADRRLPSMVSTQVGQ